jgi:hypothetical protein
MLQIFIPLFYNRFSPGMILTTVPLVVFHLTVSGVALPSGMTALYELMGMLLLLVILGVSCVQVGQRAYYTGWEGLQAAPESRSKGSFLRSKKDTRGSFLWEVAWHLPGVSTPLAACVGFCWQDARYDWTRWYGVLISMVMILIFFPGISVGSLVPVFMLGITLAFSLLVTRGVGARAVSRVMEARVVLGLAPIRAGTIFVGCLLSVILPNVVLTLIMGCLALALIGFASPLFPLTISCMLVGAMLTCLVSISSSAFAIGSAGGKETRLSSLLASVGNLAIYLSLETIVGRAVFTTLDPSLQRLILRLLEALTHLSWGTLPGESFQVFIVAVALLIIVSLSIAGWYRISQELYREV